MLSTWTGLRTPIEQDSLRKLPHGLSVLLEQVLEYIQVVIRARVKNRGDDAPHTYSRGLR